MKQVAMTELQELIFIRRKKKIKLWQIADQLKCTVAYLSMYENEKRDMTDEKKWAYKDIILNWSGE